MISHAGSDIHILPLYRIARKDPVRSLPDPEKAWNDRLLAYNMSHLVSFNSNYYYQVKIIMKQ
jgi:hypothetical protein